MSTDSVGAVQASVHRVETWRRGSVNRRIFAAMVTVAAGALALKLAATGKDMVVAAHFGTSDAVDAFFIALTVPTFVIYVIAGSLPAALVPAYVRVRDREGAPAAGRLLSGVLGGGVVAAMLASILLVWAAPAFLPLLGAWFDGAKLAMTHNLFLLLVPATLFAGIATVLSAVLTAEDRRPVADAAGDPDHGRRVPHRRG
jgi:putative peptidoglycan lipid II flippase